MARWVIVGPGRAGALHAAAARATRGIEIVAAVGPRGQATEPYGRRLGLPVCTLDTLPDHIDLAIVATPPNERVDVCRTLASRGIGLLVESPLESSPAGAWSVAQLPGAWVALAANLLHAPVVGGVRARLGDEPPTHVEVAHLRPSPTWGGYLDGRWGGGALYDLGAQAVSLAAMLTGGLPTAVSADVEGDEGVDRAGRLRLSFEGSTAATVQVGWTEGVPRLDVQVATPTLASRAELLPDQLLEHDGEPVALPVPRRHRGVDERLVAFGYVDQLERVARARRGGGAPPVDAAFGARVVETLARALGRVME